MKLFRFRDRDFKDIEQVTLDPHDPQKRKLLDLEHHKTLFVFPGVDNASPVFPPPEGYDFDKDLNKYNKIKHILERALICTQDAMQPGDKPFEVVVASWDGDGKPNATRESIGEECIERLHKAKDDPSGFIGQEAQAFVDDLYKQSFDPNKITMQAWSYGTCFVQECANAIRLEGKERKRLEETGGKMPEHLPSEVSIPEIPPIYTICTSTISDIITSRDYGFPGFYMYAHNDKTLEQHTTEYQREVYDRLTKAADTLDRNKTGAPKIREYTTHHGTISRGRGSSAIVISKKRPDQAMAVILAPNHCLINRRVPVSDDEWKAGIRVKYQSKKKAELVIDHQCHRPGLFQMALPGSKYIEEWEVEKPNGKKVRKREIYEASEHARYFTRSVTNALAREGYMSYTDMLLDTTREEELYKQKGIIGQPPEQINYQINKRLAHVDVAVRPDGKRELHITYNREDYDPNHAKNKIYTQLVPPDVDKQLKQGERVTTTGLTTRRFIPTRRNSVIIRLENDPGALILRHRPNKIKPGDPGSREDESTPSR